MRLSVIIPVYNERGTIAEVIASVRAACGAARDFTSGADRKLEHDIVVVDDGSTDGTREVLLASSDLPDMIVLCHERNRGKGAAVRTGLEHATGDILLVQDADREYDPADYPRLLQPILAGAAQVVYGSRFIGGPLAGMSRLHFFGNRFLTWAANLLYGSALTDMETCYKVFTRAVAQCLDLRAARWGFDPEITAQILRAGYPIREVPISYRGRTGNDGKKLHWRDGLAVLSVLLWYRLRIHRTLYTRPEQDRSGPMCRRLRDSHRRRSWTGALRVVDKEMASRAGDGLPDPDHPPDPTPLPAPQERFAPRCGGPESRRP